MFTVIVNRKYRVYTLLLARIASTASSGRCEPLLRMSHRAWSLVGPRVGHDREPCKTSEPIEMHAIWGHFGVDSCGTKESCTAWLGVFMGVTWQIRSNDY